MAGERFALVDVNGVAWPLPSETRPEKLRAGSPAFTLARGYGYGTAAGQVLNGADGLATPEPITLSFPYKATDEAALEAFLRMLRAYTASAVFLTRAGRSALAVSGGFVVATTLGTAKAAQVQVILAPAALAPVGQDGQEVYF